MIREVAGDILLSKADVIAHAVAPADDFLTGLGKSMKEAFPEMNTAFLDYCKKLHPMPGDAWTWNGQGKKIVCLFTQQQALKKGEKPGAATIDAVDHALTNLRSVLKKTKAKTCAVSKVASGTGGMDWAKVKPLVDKHLSDLSCQVVVYTTHKPGVAAE
jgi:O-acetyl-ADP-ribose deacetylase (regulator of RNase III)